MTERQNTEDLQRAAALVTWAVVTGFAGWLAIRAGAPYAGRWPPAMGLALLNAAAMWAVMRRPGFGRVPHRAALWVQLGSALSIGLLLPYSFLPIYTIIWVAMAAHSYSFRACAWFTAAIMAAWVLIFGYRWGQDDVLIRGVLYGTFHLFALFTARSAYEADEARTQVEALNRELLATQQLLTEASRQAERTRIARDLHDLLGHHLTALSLNLQIVEHLTSGETRARVEECRAIARLLLSDVRETVSTLRDEAPVDLRRSILLLVENIPQLQVELDIAEDLAIDDVEIADTLLRCVQEAITNTLRHSGARRCWIHVRRERDCLRLDARDDGVVPTNLQEGNGLAGMRERLAKAGGSLVLDMVDNALRLRVEIPQAG